MSDESTALAVDDSDLLHYRIFLSYGSADVDFAREFQQWFLTTLGVHSFLATTEIKPGATWYSAIIDAIRRCDVGVVLLSSQSFHKDWVQFEIGALGALGKKIFVIRLPETTESPAPAPALLSSIQILNWDTDSLRITKEIASELNVPFSDNQTPAFCMQPVRRLFSETALLNNIGDRCHEAVQKPFHAFITWEDHSILPVLVDHVIPRFLASLDNARAEMKLSLPSDRRVRVAQQLLHLAQQSLDAITIVERDDWLFTGDPDSAYLNANVEAARRVGVGKARRIVIVDSSSELNKHRVESTLSIMAEASFRLRWMDEKTMVKACTGGIDPVANTLIVNGNRMTYSQRTTNEGWFCSSQQAIETTQNQFNFFWAKATDYNHPRSRRRWRWGRDLWGLR